MRLAQGKKEKEKSLVMDGLRSAYSICSPCLCAIIWYSCAELQPPVGHNVTDHGGRRTLVKQTTIGSTDPSHHSLTMACARLSERPLRSTLPPTSKLPGTSMYYGEVTVKLHHGDFSTKVSRSRISAVSGVRFVSTSLQKKVLAKSWLKGHSVPPTTTSNTLGKFAQVDNIHLNYEQRQKKLNTQCAKPTSKTSVWGDAQPKSFQLIRWTNKRHVPSVTRDVRLLKHHTPVHNLTT
ncbi:uncharacterized protein CLUP02_15526 [Colletotrichum lupini]|uniref:Uncharacterized protein n=1 Tax=Colletotrichum lupini TaxID=145971 RepID=A0A9Q8T719_9PEZI|nr:uncharacterized protein CLUP02_15526 [Colletotrichum lupini]UQC89995.1 hypothetical protein CLUP02_15526 [Colletotrichum lupini]